MNDKELQMKLELLQDGDRIAFCDIYNELKTPVFTIILRIVRNQSDAEDILQDVFIKLFQSPPKPPIRKPRAYIFQIARNLAIDGIRKQSQHVNLQDFEEILYRDPVDSAMKLDLEQAIQALSLIERQIITLHINGSLKFREIAAIVEIPLGTVLWRYRQAIDKLRSHLNGGAI